MKIEFLPEGASDCPLVRLFDYSREDLRLLSQACHDLANGRIEEFILHDEPWIESASGCRFYWRVSSTDIGVPLPRPSEPLVLQYSKERWRDVQGKLSQLLDQPLGFQWITDGGDVEVLVSPDGAW
jgi:hypothetical protein